MLGIAIDNQSMVPLYYQLKEELIRLIRTGQLRPGDVLPSESELCRDLNLSRGTVRQAISILSEQGFVQKERGRGTYVKHPKMNHDLLGEYSFGHGIQKIGLETHSLVLKSKVIIPRISITNRLELEKHEPVLNLLRIRYADHEPWIFEDTYLPEHRFPGLKDHDFTNELLCDVLEERYNVHLASVNAFVEPIVLDQEYAKYLDVESNLPALVMDRVIYNVAGEPVLYSHAVIRGDRCRYYFNIKK